MSFSYQKSEKIVIFLPVIVNLLYTCFLSNLYQILQQERHASLLSAAKNRIDLSLIEQILQHFMSENNFFIKKNLTLFVHR